MAIATEVILSQALGLAVRGLISYMGVNATNDLLDNTRTMMVAQMRGPTDGELDGMMARIRARSDRIQDA